MYFEFNVLKLITDVYVCNRFGGDMGGGFDQDNVSWQCQIWQVVHFDVFCCTASIGCVDISSGLIYV